MSGLITSPYKAVNKDSSASVTGSQLIITGANRDDTPAGDDGELQRGVALDHTLNSTGQYSGTTNVTVNGKTHAHSNATVSDNNANLMYLNTVPGAVGPANDGKLYWTDATNGETIWAYKDAANAASVAGHNDWVVANVRELQNLASYDSALPDATNFPAMTTDILISSTERQNSTTNYVYRRFLNGGFESAGNKTVTTGFHILVRNIT